MLRDKRIQFVPEFKFYLQHIRWDLIVLACTCSNEFLLLLNVAWVNKVLFLICISKHRHGHDFLCLNLWIIRMTLRSEACWLRTFRSEQQVYVRASLSLSAFTVRFPLIFVFFLRECWLFRWGQTPEDSTWLPQEENCWSGGCPLPPRMRILRHADWACAGL